MGIKNHTEASASPNLLHREQGSPPLTQQLFDRFAQRMQDRLLVPGSRLPSIRQCAKQMGVNASTVAAAYNQLQAHGWIVARAGSGYFVRDRGARQGQNQGYATLPSQQTATTPHAPSTSHMPFKATALIRGMFKPATTQGQLGMGVLPSDWVKAPFLATALRKVAQNSNLAEVSVQYGDPLGDKSLRQMLQERLRSLDIPANANHIITTIGATHALDVVSRALLKSGDTVMVEEPGWSVEFARLQGLGLRLLPVPRTLDGPDLEVIAQYCEQHAPKLYVSVSTLHNPTGLTLTPTQAHHILQLANRYGFYIAEDDTYSHFAPMHSTRLSSLDGLNRTIYIGGFAKILVPNWRVGFMAAPPSLVERLLDTKLLSTLTTPVVLERAVAHCLEMGHLHRHAAQVRARLDTARGRTVQLAIQAGLSFITPPAGLFGWVDTGQDTEQLAQRLLDKDILIAPGSLFYANHAPSTAMRINFAVGQDAQIWQNLQAFLGIHVT